MAQDDNGDKTEQATDRRRQDARRQGNVARSVDLSSSAVMLAAAASLAFFGPQVIETSAIVLRQTLMSPWPLQPDVGLLLTGTRDIGLQLAAGVLPFMAFIAAVSAAINVVQVGFLWSPEGLQPKLNRLNPIEGARRILSARALAKLGASLGKLLLVVAVATLFIWAEISRIVNLPQGDVGAAAAYMGEITIWLAVWLAVALLVLGVADFAFQRWQHERDLRMSKQEIRDEMKEMEGDPLIRQRRREAHRKLAEARELGQVPTADVVITNPTHISVAIKYDPLKTPAPIVVAKGKGEIAMRIREIAREHKIPLIERKPLAQALYKTVKVGQAIPVDMYDVFVEIMAFVYRRSGKKPPELT